MATALGCLGDAPSATKEQAMNERSPRETQTATATVETDLARLDKMMRLSARPTAVSYRRAIMGAPGLGPTDWTLTVLLTYASPADATAALAGARAVPARPELGGETWLPAEIRAALSQRPKAVAADAFTKSPLNAGTAYSVEGMSWVVVVLHTT